MHVLLLLVMLPMLLMVLDGMYVCMWIERVMHDGKEKKIYLVFFLPGLLLLFEEDPPGLVVSSALHVQLQVVAVVQAS